MSVLPSYSASIRRHPLGSTWFSMHLRCSYPGTNKYEIYGGRGIAVCKRWHSFDLFVSDMGHRPKGMTLDRIDTDGDYKPSNVRWATRKQQASNKRSNKRAA